MSLIKKIPRSGDASPKPRKREDGKEVLAVELNRLIAEFNKVGEVINAGDLGSPEPAIIDVLDSTSGTAGDELQDAGATYNQSRINDNFASVAAKVNAIYAALRAKGIILP